MTYAHQKLRNAVEALRERYTSKQQWACGNELYQVLHLTPEEFPHDVRADFALLCSDGLVNGMRESAERQMTIAHGMSDAEIERLAGCVIELYYHVEAAEFRRTPHPRHTPLHGLSRDAQS
jgi:serine/threonine protein phosphatase PrpC